MRKRDRVGQWLVSRAGIAGGALILVLVLSVAPAGIVALRMAHDGIATLSASVERVVALEVIARGFADLHQRVTGRGRQATPSDVDALSRTLQGLRAKLVESLDGEDGAVGAKLAALLDGYGSSLGRVGPVPAVASLEAKAKEFDSLVQAELQNAAEQATEVRAKQTVQDEIETLVLGVGFLGISVGIGMWYRMRSQIKRITTDLAKITEDWRGVLAGLAQGDLTKTLDVNRQGVFATMADTANATLDRLAQIFAHISGLSGTIALAAAEVAASGDRLAEQTNRQAASLKETVAALDQLASTFKTYCESAHKTNTIVNDARSAGENGVAVVGAAIEAMARIVESSEKIKRIISISEEISRRINMLAINAMVEAARAGAVGKGFGVVAREVGILAERSALASHQIKELILGSETQIQQGVLMVTQSGEALHAIVDSVDHVADLFNDIIISAAGQSGMLHEITAAVTQLDEMAETTAILAGKTQTTTQAMLEDSATLSEDLASFNHQAPRT